MLYADLENAMSNAIYQRLGYAPVCDAADNRFDG
jgi:predicted GNAT family acetyltransferase